MVDLHKEIKLSDLFKRGSKQPDEPKPEKPPKRVDLHKEIKLSALFKRGPRNPDDPTTEKPSKREKPPKEKRPSRFKRTRETPVAVQEAPPLLDIPLMRAFNLLPGEERRVREDQRSPLPYILVALAGVLTLAALAAFYLKAGSDVTSKQARIDDLRAELAVYAAKADETQPSESTQTLAAERLGRTTALSSALETRLAWDRVLRELALILPEGAAIDSIEATSPGAYNAPPASPDGTPVVHFTMIGGTDSQASVAEVLARLSVIPEFENVVLKDAARASEDNAGARHPYTFTITAALRLGS